MASRSSFRIPSEFRGCPVQAPLGRDFRLSIKELTGDCRRPRGGDSNYCESLHSRGPTLWFPKRFLNKRVACGSHDSAIVVQDNFDRHLLKQSPHASLAQERFRERRILHSGQVFGRNNAANKNPSRGHEGQSAVSSLGPIEARKNGESLFTNGGL